MYSKLRFFELKNSKFKTNHHFFIELRKVLINWRILDFWRILDSLLYMSRKKSEIRNSMKQSRHTQSPWAVFTFTYAMLVFKNMNI